jgi:NAD(P)-dependent dehydrogenase (short-subunit alcohol dehydrogenase family)
MASGISVSTREFSGKSVFITGAGSGIGYQIALAFAREGADIVATDVSPEGLAGLAPEVEREGVKYRSEILNVADEQAFRQLADQLAAEGALPDVVVNNAGIAYLDTFAHTPSEVWQRTLDVNVMGVVHGSRLFINHWQQTGRPGHLVNIASAASVTPMPNMSAYAASKYAVEGLCEVLAMELAGSNVRVSCVHPGVINTAIVRHDDRTAMPAGQVARLQKYYIDKGAHPSVVAQDILNGVKQNAGNIFTGPGTRLPPLLKRLLPRRLFRAVLRKEARAIGYL